jgi:hypothetical protein
VAALASGGQQHIRGRRLRPGEIGMRKFFLLGLSAALALSGCDAGGLSTAEAQRAAEQRVREKFGLSDGAALETVVFVGRPRDGETTVCGRVDGRAADGSAIPTQHFISSVDPARWLLFGETDTPGRIAQPGMFPDWTRLCAGAEGS